MHELQTKPEKSGVSVSWKYLAMTAITVIIGAGGYDRVSFDQRLSAMEQRQNLSPTKDDIRDLRAAIDNLSSRIDGLTDHQVFRSPRHQ